MKRYLVAFKESVIDFLGDRGLVWAAALAFYAALSFAPLVSLTMVIAGRLGPEAQNSAIGQFEELMGSAAGDTLREVATSADQNQSTGLVAGIISMRSCSSRPPASSASCRPRSTPSGTSSRERLRASAARSGP